MAQMMEADAARLCGPRYGRAEGKAGHRWGKTKGKVGFHGGKVEVSSEVGQGACFEVWLQARPSD